MESNNTLDAFCSIPSFSAASLGSNIKAVSSGFVYGVNTITNIGTNWDFMYIYNGSSMARKNNDAYDSGARHFIPIFITRPTIADFNVMAPTFSYRSNKKESEVIYEYSEKSLCTISSDGTLKLAGSEKNRGSVYIMYILYKIE